MEVRLRFSISQHSRDEQLLKSFIRYLDCGNVYNQSENVLDFRVEKISDITEKLIPFMDKYPIRGIKQKDFEDFKK